jgi:4-diphosphocytidyl-2-C-methyl-D-erythritol kinase
MAEQLDNLSGWQQRWPAPAKLNLMLRITGQRDDGYHLLQTVFQIIDLCDWLTFHPVKNATVTLQNPILGVPEADDLTVRAANLLKQAASSSQGVRIEMDKNLPMGGGLGGGSSDAATTLVVLNKLWELNFSVQKLMDLGVKLGADIPVFIYGYSAWAEGVGEFLNKMSLPDAWFVIVRPNCHVNTRDIFSDGNLTRDSKSIKMSDFVFGQHRNDCLDVVIKLYPPVKEALAALSKFGVARLTGTGACVFVQFDAEAVAKEAMEALQNNWEVYLAKGLNESPLHREVAKNLV